MLVAMIVTAWRQRGIAAGICCGLLLYKPQLAVVLAIVMALDLGPRVAAGDRSGRRDSGAGHRLDHAHGDRRLPREAPRQPSRHAD